MSDRRESQDTSFIRDPHSRLPHEVDVEDIVPLRYQTVLAVQLPPHDVGQELIWRSFVKMGIFDIGEVFQ